jgi:hypothetical protein
MDESVAPDAGSPNVQNQFCMEGLSDWLLKDKVRSPHVTKVGSRVAATGEQSAILRCNSFREDANLIPFLNSSTQIVTTYSPLAGAVPLMMPVLGSMEARLPKGCEPEKGNKYAAGA